MPTRTGRSSKDNGALSTFGGSQQLLPHDRNVVGGRGPYSHLVALHTQHGDFDLFARGEFDDDGFADSAVSINMAAYLPSCRGVKL